MYHFFCFIFIFQIVFCLLFFFLLLLPFHCFFLFCSFLLLCLSTVLLGAGMRKPGRCYFSLTKALACSYVWLAGPSVFHVPFHTLSHHEAARTNSHKESTALHWHIIASSSKSPMFSVTCTCKRRNTERGAAHTRMGWLSCILQPLDVSGGCNDQYLCFLPFPFAHQSKLSTNHCAGHQGGRHPQDCEGPAFPGRHGVSAVER